MMTAGLTNHTTEDYGVLASATSNKKIIYNHYCTSRQCANPRNPWKKKLVFQSTKITHECPECGHALITKRDNSNEYARAY